MTVLESKELNPGDLVACGKHIGRVTRTGPYTIWIEWKPGTTVIHARDEMGKIRRACEAAEQVHEELSRLGIDVTKTVDKVLRAVHELAVEYDEEQLVKALTEDFRESLARTLEHLTFVHRGKEYRGDDLPFQGPGT